MYECAKHFLKNYLQMFGWRPVLHTRLIHHNGNIGYHHVLTPWWKYWLRRLFFVLYQNYCLYPYCFRFIRFIHLLQFTTLRQRWRQLTPGRSPPLPIHAVSMLVICISLYLNQITNIKPPLRHNRHYNAWTQHHPYGLFYHKLFRITVLHEFCKITIIARPTTVICSE